MKNQAHFITKQFARVGRILPSPFKGQHKNVTVANNEFLNNSFSNK